MTASELEDLVVTLALRKNSEKCAICNAGESELYQTLGVETISEYNVECTYCGGGVSFTETESRNPSDTIGDKETRSVEEVECKGCGERYETASVVDGRAPSSVSIEADWTVSYRTNPIHHHHVSYDPPVTTPLCAPHHTMVHKSDGFFDGLDYENWNPSSEVSQRRVL